MERHEGKLPGIGNGIAKELDRIKKQRRIKKFIGTIIGAIAIYFTCKCYDWKLAIIIVAFIWGNNLEQDNK